MNLFPFYENIEDKTFLVIGGGKVAKGKIEKLKLFTNRIVVVAEETDIEDVKVHLKSYATEDLNLGDYCIVATSDRELNKQIARECGERNILVNVVDDPELCTFVFPAIVKRGDLVVSITTAGKSPAYAGMLRKEIQDMLPDNIENIMDRMANLRQLVPEMVPEQAKRSLVYKTILSFLLERENQVSDEELIQIIKDMK